MNHFFIFGRVLEKAGRNSAIWVHFWATPLFSFHNW